MMDKLLAAAGVVTALAAAAAVLWGIFRWGLRITDGAKCQLRSEMLRTYYHHKETQIIRQYEYENFIFVMRLTRHWGVILLSGKFTQK